jgi:signal transduction histidine kinase
LFTQGERTPDRAQGGLGLGLTLVKSIVAMHGGEVGANSAGPGKGSSFVIALPRLKAEPAIPPDMPKG